MNIDLLLTNQGEPGLVSDKAFGHPVAGVMYDAESGMMSLEFSDADSLELNIPVDTETGQYLRNTFEIQVGIIERGVIADNRQVPLVLLNDPFGGGNAGHFPVAPRKSVIAFESFMNRCTNGQPVHRDDLGADLHTSGSILGSVSPAVLQFAPHLARQKTMEASPHLAPSAPAPGMGMGGGGSAGGSGGPQRQPQRQPQPPRKSGNTDDN